ncbi:MAG TPA: hypothetical protein PK307_11965 [Spirochaetota bacterium]|nr:hypothetical protein [Spirochaetota bacterium]HOD14464.1 hypothetical protein [Spirochaetota bacterium]HPN13049.1 hypothetical protein [Spirochaetota bacterium]HQL82912.1 hypothetical protein [Spirochaetota bacterium]
MGKMIQIIDVIFLCILCCCYDNNIDVKYLSKIFFLNDKEYWERDESREKGLSVHIEREKVFNEYFSEGKTFIIENDLENNDGNKISIKNILQKKYLYLFCINYECLEKYGEDCKEYYQFYINYANSEVPIKNELEKNIHKIRKIKFSVIKINNRTVDIGNYDPPSTYELQIVNAKIVKLSY